MSIKKTNNCILVDYENLSPIRLQIKSDNLSLVSLEFENINRCPICNTPISPEVQSSIAFNAFDNYHAPKVLIINRCPNCNDFFVVCYNAFFDPSTYSFQVEPHDINFIAPQSYDHINFDPCIHSISKRFIKVYNQAAQAESLGLDEISDMGFRKALEILVKDYAISMFSDDNDKIVNMPLSNCIKTYINNPKIQLLATKATWLGNDKAHYTQFLNNHDSPSIKTLIETIVHFIGLEDVLQKAAAIPHKSNLKTP